MPVPRQLLGALVVLVVAIGGVTFAAPSNSPAVKSPTARAITPTLRAATFTYDPSVDPASRQLIEQSIAGARPEAQRLIGAVDGLVTLRVGTTGPDTAGTTQPGGGRYVVTLDISSVLSGLGPRGVQRLVLHELGHVVDGVLVPEDLDKRLDAMIPPGLPCPPDEPLGSCAPEQERFAETFAKWAMFNDIGTSLYIGYAVPPTDFDAWAAPLIPLAG
jgi:hypothetical protein